MNSFSDPHAAHGAWELHAIYAFYMLSGAYHFDIHGTVIDWIAVPAAVYFLWVVQALYRGTFHDWNGAPGTVAEAMGGERVPAAPEPAPAPARA